MTKSLAEIIKELQKPDPSYIFMPVIRELLDIIKQDREALRNITNWGRTYNCNSPAERVPISEAIEALAASEPLKELL